MNKRKSYGGVSLVSAENFYSMREGMDSKLTYNEVKTRRRYSNTSNSSASLNSDRSTFDKTKRRVNSSTTKSQTNKTEKLSSPNGQVEKRKEFHLKSASTGFSKSADNVENPKLPNKNGKCPIRKHSLSFSNDQPSTIDFHYAKDSSSADSSAYASYEDLSGDKNLPEQPFVLKPVKWISNDLSSHSSAFPFVKKSFPMKNLDLTRICTHCYGSTLIEPHKILSHDFNLKSNGHYIFHYSVNHPLTLHDYSFDECPICRPESSHKAKIKSINKTKQKDKNKKETTSVPITNSEFAEPLTTNLEPSDSNSKSQQQLQEDLSGEDYQFGYVHKPSISFTFSSPPHPFKGNVFLDLNNTDVQLHVDRLSPVREITTKDRRQQISSNSSNQGSTLSSESLIFDNPYYQYFNPFNCMYLLPEPIRCHRDRDVFNSLKTCLVPPHEIRTYQMTQPSLRQWRNFKEKSTNGMNFTLLCYNVLCPSYATQAQYPYCPAWCLSWDYRRRGILEELESCNADIICLQELETLDYKEVFKKELEKHQYDSVFLPKSRSRTMMETDSKNVDGCAIFWKRDMFEKVYEFHQEFMHSCTSLSENPSPVLLNRVMTKDNIALGVIFKTKSPEHSAREFCITTGHIHWNPEFSDVKLIQTIMWTTELRRYIENYLSSCSSDGQCHQTEQSVSSMPVIVCGDFNSLPDSGVVDYLMQGGVNCQHAEFRGLGTNYAFADWTSLQKGLLDGDQLRHGFKFDRAYKENEGMRWTNYTYDFRGMIDYIFFTETHFRLLKSLDMIEESWFESQKILACPYVHNHSDHFSLLVELELCD